MSQYRAFNALMTMNAGKRGPGLKEGNQKAIIAYLMDARREGHEGKTSDQVAKEIKHRKECARDHLNDLMTKYKWGNGRSGGVVYRKQYGKKGFKWYITDDYWLWSLENEQKEWNRKKIESGGYTQQVILEHFHHVCGGMVELFRDYGIDVTSRLSPDQLRKMDLVLNSTGAFKEMAKKHLHDGYRGLCIALRKLEADRKEHKEKTEHLFTETEAKCLADIPFENLAPPFDPFYSRLSPDVFHKRLCHDLAKNILQHARLMNEDGRGIFDYGIITNGNSAYPRRSNTDYFCRAGHEAEVQRYVEDAGEKMRERVAELDHALAHIEDDSKNIADELLRTITIILESKDLKGICAGCPRPGSIIA